jgi:hypothetical protein
MAQVEDPANLDRWDSPAYRLITLILIRCGLRITDVTAIAADCAVRDAGGAPYLRYYNRKMKREALVPIDDELESLIAGQRGTPASPGGRAAPRSCSPAPRPTSAAPGPPPAALTGKRSAAGWRTATSATSTANPCT